MTDRLSRELALLYTAEAAYKVAAAPVVRQLIADDARPLPDKIPVQPGWVEFEWPASGSVDFERYWRERDRNQSPWTKEYL